MKNFSPFQYISKAAICIVFTQAFSSWNVHAQSKVEKTGKQVEEVAETISALKGLFGSKKKPVEAPKSTVVPVATAQVGSNAIFFTGKISPKAKVIICDYMGEFNRGAAVIKKGLEYALIDSTGDFIVPFQKFTGITDKVDFRGSGFFFAVGRDAAGNKKSYYINSKGKIVVDLDEYVKHDFALSNDGKYLTFKPTSFMVYGYSYLKIVDYEGNKSTLTVPEGGVFNQRETLRDSIFIYTAKVGSGSLYGFKNSKNQSILAPSLDYLQQFSDGVAIFGKKDDLGIIRYGVIDKTGKALIQPTFKEEQLGDYHYGAAQFKTDAAAGFIDKQGNVFYKFSSEGSVFGRSQSDFIEKYSIGSSIVNKRGQFISKGLFFKQIIGIDPTLLSSSGLDDKDYHDGMLRFSFRSKKLGEDFYGVHNIKTGSTLYGKFTDDDELYLDNVSHLMYLKYNTEKRDRFGLTIYIEGYINQQGEFVLIKGGTQ